MLERYEYKIKTVHELQAALGLKKDDPLKRIMCHGVFDIVHPGHVRHLLYAKSKADILIVSITADIHVNKGPGRPHVPQDLRALNLAAFEMVDYVVIDHNATPLENLKLIQPDFYARGFEYNAHGPGTKIAAEAEAVRAYGGEIIFTPGDVVYSSSALIGMAPPSLRYEKLAMLMERHGLEFDGLRQTLGRMQSRKVHVVGDTIVDSLTHCTPAGGPGKTPTISVIYERREDFVGGAAVVAKHLAAAGGDVSFSTVLGGDAFGKFALDDLADTGIHVQLVVDASRPTVNKNAIVAGGYRLLKIDTLDNRSISDKSLADLVSVIVATPAEAVVFSDFRHGIFNKRTVANLINVIPDGAYKVADSQVASRWGNITDFRGFDLICPNEREARFALGDQDSGIRPLASRLYDAAGCKLLMLKLGERGLLGCNGNEGLDNFFVLDSFAEHVTDAVGAGDAFLAYATLAMLAGGGPAVAAILGSLAAALECEREGNVPIGVDSVRGRVDNVEKEMRP